MRKLFQWLNALNAFGVVVLGLIVLMVLIGLFLMPPIGYFLDSPEAEIAVAPKADNLKRPERFAEYLYDPDVSKCFVRYRANLTSDTGLRMFETECNDVFVQVAADTKWSTGCLTGCDY